MDNLMSVKEVSQYFNVKPMTIYRWVKKGILPSIKVGRSLRFKKDSVANIGENRRSASGAADAVADVFFKIFPLGASGSSDGSEVCGR